MTSSIPKPNPLRGRFNAWMMAKFEDDFHREVGARKEAELSEFCGTVVEIGAGNGNNFRYYPPGIKLVVYEPNPYMHPRLLEAVQAHALDYELRARSAEDLEFEDNSVDAVVCTLVLCTVPDPARVISEVHRVLKPGGTLLVTRRKGPDAKLFVGRYRNVQQFEAVLTGLGLEEVHTNPWQEDYDQVFGRKPVIGEQ